MSIESPSDRLERAESWLKTKLGEEKQTMRVDDGHGNWKSVTLLEIYAEWMDYLVKNNFDKKEDNLLKKWKNFLLERNTDAIADLLVGFFEAKRRYGRDLERNEDKRSWSALCRNYCEKWGWKSDKDLLLQFFSSYSAAERRVRGKMKEGKILGDASLSLLKSLSLAKEGKKRKADEKLKKKKRAEERERKKEENAKKKTGEKTKKPNVASVKNNDSDITEPSDWDEEDKEVDPDYPKSTEEGRRDPTDPRFRGPRFPADNENGNNKDGNEIENGDSKVGKVNEDGDNKDGKDAAKDGKESIIKDGDGKRKLIRPDGQRLFDFGE